MATEPRAGLAARRALVTGAGRGIGRAIAIELARAGAAVAIAARTADELAATRQAVEALGARCASFTVDLADRAAATRLAPAAEAELGAIDILVNNAGVGSWIDPRPVASFSDQAWDLTLATNLTAPYLLSKAVLPGMIARAWGRVINIGSIVATVGAEKGSAYAASKGGLVAFTKSLALEVARHGITANAICPGPVRTRSSDRRLEQIAAEKGVPLADLERTLTPMGRRLDPAEIAHVAAFLASDAAAAITGQAWHVDAGAVMR